MPYLGLLDKKCSILRPRRSDAWADEGTAEEVAGNVPCRLQPASGREWSDGSVRGQATHVLFLPWGTDVRASDVVGIGNRRFEILPPVGDAGGQGHHLELSLKERL